MDLRGFKSLMRHQICASEGNWHTLLIQNQQLAGSKPALRTRFAAVVELADTHA